MRANSTAGRPALTSSDVAKVFAHCYGLIESGRAARVRRSMQEGVLTVAVIDSEERAAAREKDNDAWFAFIGTNIRF